MEKDKWVLYFKHTLSRSPIIAYCPKRSTHFWAVPGCLILKEFKAPDWVEAKIKADLLMAECPDLKNLKQLTQIKETIKCLQTL